MIESISISFNRLSDSKKESRDIFLKLEYQLQGFKLYDFLLLIKLDFLPVIYQW